MIRHDQMAYLRRQIAAEDRMAQTAPTLDERIAHAELATYYRAEMRDLILRRIRDAAHRGDAPD